MSKRSLLAVAVCAAVAGLSAGPALAGEVKGPPGSSNPPAEPNYTGAVTNSNSICSYSGQNDGHPPAGRVQSYGQDVRAGREDPHVFNPGDVCQGGSNHNRDK